MLLRIALIFVDGIRIQRPLVFTSEVTIGRWALAVALSPRLLLLGIPADGSQSVRFNLPIK